MRRREFIKSIPGLAAAWPLAASAQHPVAIPVVAFINASGPEAAARRAAGFRGGLSEAGFVEGQNVAVEYHWLEGHYDQIPALVADLVRRKVAVIAVPGITVGALAAKAATTTIPIVFAAGGDAVQLGLVASLSRPGGNVTGINFFVNELIAKRLRLLHDLVPKAVRVAVLVNSANTATSEAIIKDVQEAAPGMGLQIQIFNASTIRELDLTFAGFADNRPDALFVAPDGFFTGRAVQFATLTARDRIPATYSERDTVAAGGLMSYGTDIADAFRQVGTYTGRILKGEKPADLPVLQSTKFLLSINTGTARALGIEVRPDLLTIADEVIE
jgi:putative ABC transport system substrate-binding protein